MGDIAFSEPVVLDMPGTGARLVTSSFEALECLENEWPAGARDRNWRRAYMICRDALDGWRTPGEARRSLARAAARAGLMASRHRRRTAPWLPGPLAGADLPVRGAAG